MASVFESVFVPVVLTGMFFVLARGWYSSEVVVFLALLVVWNAGIISGAEALSGFNNPATLIVGALFVIVTAIKESRLVARATTCIFGQTTTFNSGLARVLVCALSMSAFINTIPVLALLMPIAQDWGHTRGFDRKTIMMPLAFACSFGALLTTLGSATNLLIQELLYEAGKSDDNIVPFGVLDPGKIGLPLAVIGVGYLLLAAPRLLAIAPSGNGFGAGRVSGGETCSRDRSEDLFTEVEVTGSSELVDKPFRPTLALLGLPADTLVKVRRRRSNPAVRSPLPQSRSRLDGGGLPLAVGVTTGIAGKNGLDLHEGDEESNGVGWGVIRTGGGSSSASMVTTSVAEGSPSIISGGGINSLSPALRHRSLYQRLATNGGAKMPAKKRLRDAAAAAPCIEMPSMRSTEGEIDHHCTDSRARGYPVGASSEIFSCAAVVGAAAEDHGGWFEDVHDVSPEDKVRAGDVLVLSCDQESMVRVQGSIVSHRRRGVNILGVSTHKLEAPGTVFLELVLSRFSDFLGRVARLDHEFFASRYGCSVVGFRLKGSTGGSGGGGRGSDVIGCWAAKQTNSNKKGCSIYKGDLKAARIPPGRKSCDGAPNAADGGVQDASLTMNGGESDFSTTVTGSPLDSTAPTPLMASPTQQRDEGSSSCNGSPVVRGVGLPVSETFQRGEGFAPGDTVLVLATEDLFDKMACVGEFLIKKRVGCLPEPVGWFQCFPLLIFAAMIAWVVLLDVSMVRAAFAACAVLILGGWIDAKQAVGVVNWGLLLLIGSALGCSKAMANSGLADYAGEAIRESGMSPPASLFVLFGFTMVCTELISNNATAALTLPIALNIAREMDVSYKPFAMAVMIGASSPFLTPIGTATNTMVWAPGGYKFQDFAKLGAPLSLLFWFTASAIIPWVFPF